MGSTLTTWSNMLKARYTKEKVENLTQADRPLLAMLRKDTEQQGSSLEVPLLHVNPQGIAGSGIATAQTSATNMVAKKFSMTCGDYFGSVYIGDKVIKASRGNPGAFLENKVAETDGLYDQMSDDLAVYIWGNGGNTIGQRASASTNVITLSSPEQTLNFEEGMTIGASVGDGSNGTDAPRAGTTTVASVQREAGTVTLTSAAAITSFADNDYLFRQGDFFGNTGTVVLKGVQAFITATGVPAALWGMTRTGDPQRLAGCRVPTADYTAKTIDERCRILGSYMSGRYKTPGATAAFLHPEDWTTLETVMGARGIRPLQESNTKFGFMKIDVVMGGRVVSIYPDRYCPKGTMFALRMQNWWLSSMGELLSPMEEDGLVLLRGSNTMDYEYRLVGYPILACNAPGYNGRVPLTG
jgi:hypothetical protein